MTNKYNTEHEESIDWDYLYSILDYDENTGIFTNKVFRGGSASIGTIAGYLDNSGYVRVRIKGKLVQAHRLAWFYVHAKWPTELIDHIDGAKNNNSIKNLREATESQNKYNSTIRKDNTTGYKGVSFDKSKGKFVAYIQINGKPKRLGCFSTAEEAGSIYLKEATKLHGEFFNGR